MLQHFPLFFHDQIFQWGVVGFVTYGFVPLHLRVVFVSVVQVGWNAYLSGLNERSRQRSHIGGS